MVGRRSADKSAFVISELAPFHRPMCRPIIARLKGNRPTIGLSSADDRPIVQFCDFISKSMGIVFNVIASVGRQIDVYRPIKIHKSYRPNVF